MSDLINQPSAAPTRKVTASSAVAGLVAALVAAIVGILPGDPSAEVRDAITVLIDGLVGFAAGGGATFLAGYFVRDRSEKRI